jgi:hypothetical protein
MRFTRACAAFLALLFTVALSVSPVLAQTTLTTTTLTTALNDVNKTVVVGSATNVVAGNYLFIDREAMLVQSVSGTTAQVVRGFAGTAARAHLAGSTVTAATPSQFYQSEANGACTLTAEAVTPRIVLPTGNVYTCLGGIWNRVGADNGVLQVSHSAAAAADYANAAIFIADRDYILVGARASWETVTTSGTLDIRKATGTTACGSGTTMLASTISTAGAINTVNNATLTATPANLLVAAGNRICAVFSGTVGSATGLNINLALVPR